VSIQIMSPETGETFSPGQMVEVAGTLGPPESIAVLSRANTTSMAGAKTDSAGTWSKTITLPSEAGTFHIVVLGPNDRAASVKVIVQNNT
jgi:hypothetical protein